MNSPGGGVPAELLRASLCDKPPSRAPYSVQTGAIVAFFGGAIGSIVLALLNSTRLGRGRRDAPWLVAVVLAFAGVTAWWHLTATGFAFDDALRGLLGASGPRIAERALGMLVFGVAAWFHRREQRATDFFDRPRPNGLWVGLGLILFDGALMRGLLAWME